MAVVCEGYRGVVVYLELLLWKFTDASRDVLGTSAITTTDQVTNEGIRLRNGQSMLQVV
jgi:hypothetical protein